MIEKIIQPEISCRQYWARIGYRWHNVNDIPGTIFWSFWNKYIESDEVELNGDKFRRIQLWELK